jgi:hypothetical protein
MRTFFSRYSFTNCSFFFLNLSFPPAKRVLNDAFLFKRLSLSLARFVASATLVTLDAFGEMNSLDEILLLLLTLFSSFSVFSSLN